ncbi:endosomal P24A protein-like protein, partial [Aureobasidium melanogenum]
MRFSELSLSLCALLLAGPSSVASFYLPGVAPTNYQLGDRVPLTVNRLTPSQSEQDTQVRSVFAFDYYHHAFHHCEPEGGPKQKSESLGSILFGDRIQTSPLELHMGKNETCKAVCGKQTFQPRDAKFVNARILQNYNVNWNIDGLPAAQKMIDANEAIFYSPGFALGQVHGSDTQTPVLNNHYNIFVEYHQAAQDHYRVVGVLVEPASSIDSKLLDDGKVECGDIAHPVILSEKDATEIVWTYSVYWVPSPTSFATRWDKYLHVYDPRIHWVSLTISALIVVALVGMVSTILLRTLRKDIARYNRLDDLGLDDFGGTSLDDTVQEDSGWKLVHGDVFRPPRHPMVLSILVGNGAQLFMMTGFTIAFALLGFLSPSNRGSLTTVMVMLYTFFGAVGGYVSARVYKFFHGESWKLNIAYTPLLVPGTVFAVFFLLNLFVWARQSSGAVPFTTMLALVSIWFLISVPLSVGGSWLGFRAAESTPPVRTNQIPRQIPPSTGYLRPLPSMLLVGILPFGAIFLELYFIISSIWFSRIYYMFGFLFLCYGLMIVTSAAVTILMVYFALCAENYHWQWRAFFTSGASAIYVFLYAMLYWVRALSFTSWTSGVLYLGYSALISALWFVLTGTIGFVATWAFVYRIYGSLKID